jgi:hypothetical protein
MPEVAALLASNGSSLQRSDRQMPELRWFTRQCELLLPHPLRRPRRIVRRPRRIVRRPRRIVRRPRRRHCMKLVPVQRYLQGDCVDAVGLRRSPRRRYTADTGSLQRAPVV